MGATWGHGRLAALWLCASLAACENGKVIGPAEPTSETASEMGARRLSNAEIDDTLIDLLGDDSRPAARLLVSDQFTPYDNDTTTQQPSEALVTSLEIMSGEVADRLIADVTRRDELIPCTPSGPGDADCLRQFIEDWVPRALRRPIEPAEVEAFLALQTFAVEDTQYITKDFYTGVNLVVRTALQHPEFLYRVEVGRQTEHAGVLALDDWEIATRLSYLLWGTMPDDELRAEAAAGRLTDASGRRAAAERMMSDGRAKRQMRRFHALWLGHRVLPQPPELVAAFSRETGALLDRVIFDEPQSYHNLFTFGETYLDDFLADHYGLPRPAGGEGWVSYGSSGRAGILSQGSVLAAAAKFADTSPTQRGILIRTRLMCDEILPPPPTVMVDNAPGDAEAECKYDRYAQHRTSPSCAACHDGMDPIGFGLENYDMQGRYREHDDGLPECPIEGQGALPDDLGSFSGPAELAEILLANGYIDACVMEQLYQFAVGRAVDEVERPVVDALIADFNANGYDMRELLLNFVTNERFALRREPTVVSP